MSETVHNNDVYVRGFREVGDTRSIRHFQARVGQICLGVFEDDDATLLRLPELLDPEAIINDVPPDPVHLGVGINAATVYPINGLRYTAFEHIASTASEAKICKRLYVRTDEFQPAGSDQNLAIRCSNITNATLRRYAHLGKQYALTIDAGEAATALTEQSHQIHEKIKVTGPGSQLLRKSRGAAFEPPKLEIPFIRVPATATKEQIEQFEYWVTLACLPLRGIALSRLRWRSST